MVAVISPARGLRIEGITDLPAASGSAGRASGTLEELLGAINSPGGPGLGLMDKNIHQCLKDVYYDVVL